MSSLTPTTVWTIDAPLVRALDEYLGPPIDSYLNGTQTWLTPIDRADGADDLVLEWRLHPVAQFALPAGCRHDELWEAVIVRLDDPDGDLSLGTETRRLDSLWDGLECFPAYGEEIEPTALSKIATDMLTLSPQALGLVDHHRIGSNWENSQGRESLTRMLLDELSRVPNPTV